MSWFHVNDRAHSHEKFIASDERGLGAWVKLGSWSAERLTDGVVPGGVARRLCTKAGLNEGVKARLLFRDEAADTYTISGYLDCNPSAEKVKERRAGEVSRQHKHRGHGGITPSVTEPVTRDSGGGVTRDLSRARPATPAPASEIPPKPPQGGGVSPGEPLVLSPEEPKGRKRKPRASVETPLPDDWGPKPSHYADGVEVGLDRDGVDFQAKRFRAWALSKGKTYVDWDKTFQNALLGWLTEDRRGGPAARASRPIAVAPEPGGSGRIAAEMERLRNLGSDPS